MRVSLSNAEHVIVNLKGKHVYFRAEHVCPVVPDTQATDVYETDVTALLPADQGFVPPKKVKLETCLSEQQKFDRMQGVVMFVAGNKAHGRIATLKNGVPLVRQKDVIGGGLLHVGQLCTLNMGFDRQATLVLLGPEAESDVKEEYRQASRRVELMVDVEMSKPGIAEIFTEHKKDVIAALKRSSKVSVDEHACEIEAMLSRKKKRTGTQA